MKSVLFFLRFFTSSLYLPVTYRTPMYSPFTGEQISDEAKKAETTGDLWSLFFREATLDKIVRYTNDKIRETLEKNVYNLEDLRKQTYMKLLDRVNLFYFYLLCYCWISNIKNNVCLVCSESDFADPDQT